ncbi:MAG: glutathione S-transferase family protein [Polyangiaceae bacterium]|jgi:glutathione S-transferase
MIKIWGHSRSSNVQKVLWAADELGLIYERIEAGGTFGKNKTPEYLALNPNGLVPTLEDEGLVVWESHAIVRYLYLRYGNAGAAPASFSKADRWTDWQQTTLWPPVRSLVVQLVRTPEKDRDPKAIALASEQVVAALRLLDAHLSKSAFVAGDSFGFGDIPLGIAVQRWVHLPVLRPTLPHVERWYGSFQSRPPFKKWVAHPLA